MKYTTAFILILSLLVHNVKAEWDLISSKDDSISYLTVYFTDDSTGYIGGGSQHVNYLGGLILRTTDGGITWDTTTVPLWPKSFHFPSQDTGYVIGASDSVYRTTDGGQTWNAFDMGFYYGGDVESVYFIDNENGFATAYNIPKLAKTTNGGLSWSEDTTFGGWQIDFPSSDVGYIIEGLGIYKTINGGTDWSYNVISAFDILNDTSYYNVSFVNDTLGFIAGFTSVFAPPVLTNYGVIAKTVDGGLSWSTQVFPSVGQFFSIYFVNENVGYATGNGVVLTTTDGGITWGFQKSDSGSLPANIMSVHCTNDSNCYMVSKFPGAIYKTTDGGGPVGISESKAIIQNELIIYPNPTTGQISFSGMIAEPTKITLYNALGVLVNEVELKGLDKPVIDISTFSNGLYLIQLECEQTTVRAMVIKQ